MATVRVAYVLLLVLLTGPALIESAVNITGCTELLQTLLPCLNYVQGNTNIPTASCCSSLLVVHNSNPTCLCELIVSSVSGSAQLPANINSTRAIALGPACNVATRPRRCPTLLDLSPSSPEAKIFETGPPLASPAGAPAQGPSASASGNASPPESGSSLTTAGFAGTFLAMGFLIFAAGGF